MAILGMNDAEFNYYQAAMTEAVKMIGQDAYLFPVDSVTEDIYSDKDIVYNRARKIGLLFESNPKPILKKFQWLSEDDELPYLAYIVPFDHKSVEFTVEENMLIRIDSKRVLQSERVFIVTRVRGTTLDPLMWMCTLAPYRPKVDMVPDTPEYNATLNPKTDTGYTYLKREG